MGDAVGDIASSIVRLVTAGCDANHLSTPTLWAYSPCYDIADGVPK